jgi:disulfide bond formation protein DsbB
MSFETMKLFFAMGAVVANLLTVALLIIGVVGRNKDKSPFEFLRGMTLWLAGAVAIAATVGSLYLSEVVHLIPCKLCWYQRIAMYPLAVLLPVAAWRKDNDFRLYAAIAAVIGLGVATWHRLMQAFPSLDSGACAAVGPPCSAPYIMEFGFVTIPYMAMSSFALILALLWANRVNSTRTVATSS